MRCHWRFDINSKHAGSSGRVQYIQMLSSYLMVDSDLANLVGNHISFLPRDEEVEEAGGKINYCFHIRIIGHA